MKLSLAATRLLVSGVLLGLSHAAAADLLVAPGMIERVLQQCSRPAPGPVEQYWVPTPEVLAQLEADLQSEVHFKRALKGAAGDLLPLKYYDFEFAGVVLKGKRLVYINAFVSNRGGFAPVVVCDGGNLYWGALWDPQSRRFSDLQINGR